MRKKGTKVSDLFPERRRDTRVSAHPPAAAPSAAGMPVTLGWIVAVGASTTAGTSLLVDYPGSPHGTQPARLAVATTMQRLEDAIARRQPAVLVFENGDPLLPLVVGLVETTFANEATNVIEADVDGKRVRVVGKDEIVLQCGQASVTLRRNGRILIRGTYVETQSEGTNRIKGGQVQIN